MPKKTRRAAEDHLLTALACGATVENAARSAGISESTAYRRLKDQAFQQRLHDIRADIVQRTEGVLTAAAGEAVKTLLALQKETIAPSARLGAARAILELGMKMRELGEIQERLTELEQRLRIQHKEPFHAA